MLWWSLWTERTSVWFDVEQGCAVETIKAAYCQSTTADVHEFDERCPNQVRSNRRSQCKCTKRSPVTARALRNQVAPTTVQPVKNFDPLIFFEAVKSISPYRINDQLTFRSIIFRLPRTVVSIGPRRADRANKAQGSILSEACFGSTFVWSNSVLFFQLALPRPVNTSVLTANLGTA